jgi:DNA topoisomerase-1
VGNEVYTEQNASFGLTTLRREHVDVDGDRVRLRFDGKSGSERDIEVRDGSLSRLVRELVAARGDNLFVYEGRNGDSGETPLRPEHINAYLGEVLGSEVTAKDFRTWHATTEVLRRLRTSPSDDETERATLVLEAIDAIAYKLGNSRAIARRFYVHPGLIRVYEEGRLPKLIERASYDTHARGYRKDERLLLALLPELDAAAGEPA